MWLAALAFLLAFGATSVRAEDNEEAGDDLEVETAEDDLGAPRDGSRWGASEIIIMIISFSSKHFQFTTCIIIVFLQD